MMDKNECVNALKEWRKSCTKGVINAAKGTIDPPKTHKRTFTNFIR